MLFFEIAIYMYVFILTDGALLTCSFKFVILLECANIIKHCIHFDFNQILQEFVPVTNSNVV